MITQRRCAVYTRKSSEEGLDQAFNSLDAQRDACEAYIRSQKTEGWVLAPGAFDDGGISGGTMERPGLRRLLGEIERGRVDVVVVYKVDRLTRSLADFAKMVELFDAKGVSFVSVTQQFNTTSSMGRLTLNVLLSFAQFEREVTGERIRDKIAASKARGMWMGGLPPIGYDPSPADGPRTLVINELEAEQVRSLFRRYVELGSVFRLRRALAAEGARSKVWVTKSGKSIGGVAFSTGSLLHLLKNRLYLGELPHRGSWLPGLHSPIVDPEVFEAAQQLMLSHTQARGPRVKRSTPAPLKGIVFDGDNRAMSPSTARGRDPTKRYRYYVSSGLTKGDTTGLRLSAPLVEAIVLERAARLSGYQPGVTWSDLKSTLKRVHVWSDRVRLTIALNREEAGPRLEPDEAIASSDNETCTVEAVVCLRPRGGDCWVDAEGAERLLVKPRVNGRMVKAIGEGRRLAHNLKILPDASRAVLAQAKGADSAHARTMVRLVYLAPDIQEAILQGRQPRTLNLEQLIAADLPVSWAAQRQVLGFT